jgi:hypothetical protein
MLDLVDLVSTITSRPRSRKILFHYTQSDQEYNQEAQRSPLFRAVELIADPRPERNVNAIPVSGEFLRSWA